MPDVIIEVRRLRRSLVLFFTLESVTKCSGLHVRLLFAGASFEAPTTAQRLLPFDCEGGAACAR